MEELVEEDMTPRFIKDLGMRYPTELSKQRSRYGLYECPYCGKHWEVVMGSVKCGDTKSCGCLRGESHGLKGHKLYGTWRQMVQRCTNSKHENYKNYGGRGIIVCEEWLDIKKFIAWAESTHPNIEGYTLDRIDNDKGYNPDNCRWADRTAQVLNRRIMKNNKSGYTGVSWCKVRGMWTIRIKIKTKNECLGNFDDLMKAVIFRDQYIIENKLPHKLNLKHIGENK